MALSNLDKLNEKFKNDLNEELNKCLYKQYIYLMNSYCQLFQIDNQISLIAKKNINPINYIRQAIIYTSKITPKNYSGNLIKLIEKNIKLKKLIHNYYLNSQKRFKFIKKDFTDDCQQNSFSNAHLKLPFLILKLKENLDYIHNAYELYRAISNKNIFVEPLIEFNNCLSHLIKCSNNKCENEILERNIKRANAHLYRGTLDIYKVTIKKLIDINDKNLLDIYENDFLKVRKKELIKIGASENNKFHILEDYEKVVVKIINYYKELPNYPMNMQIKL